MTTGLDVLLYIIENELLYEKMFLTEEEAAVKFKVGIQTIKVWCELNYIFSIKKDDKYFIPVNAVVMIGGKKHE